MARIRSIKPAFFRHARLFDAEKETGLPLRVAFAGLWTTADRDGRFEWNPRELKLDALPYDEVDFSRVLDALWTRGHIAKYACGGKEYGFIPSWEDHQVINNRESVSVLPAPDESSILTPTCTREARVNDATTTPLVHAPVEGKGREGKGNGREGDSPAVTPKKAKTSKPKPESATSATWASYAAAYEARYSVAPVRNATVNGQLAQFVARVSVEEAPAIAEFYLGHTSGLYRSAQHPVNLLLRDAESLRTQWATGRQASSAAKSFQQTDYDAKVDRINRLTGGLAGARPMQPDFIDMEAANGPATAIR